MSNNKSSKRTLFEVSWEICNMVGGIHTVVSTKVTQMKEFYSDNYIVVGPDTSRTNSLNGIFREEAWNPELLRTLQGLKISCRMGRWLVPGEPKCLLLQFDTLYESKNQILAEYWERFGLNSISGGPDYLEPLMFGHAAGIVIEKIFTEYLLPKGIETVVHCHEWLSSGALLYLKERTPEIGTVFTTHATVLGRTLSSHHIDFRQQSRDGIQPEYLAQQYGVSAKHSLENISTKVADVFTTVSEISSEECDLFFRKKPDFMLANALGDHIPDPALLQPQSIAHARERLFEIASLTTGHTYDPAKTTLFVASGRYEFKNKGVDLTLDALAKLNQSLKEMPGRDVNSKVVAFMMFPAGQSGPRPKILEAYRQKHPTGDHFFSTHHLWDEAHDPILTRMAPLGFRNGKDCAVHVVFIPIYLNGTDPLIPETYYQLLSAADFGVFPSYYEPWGYTPEESVALGVPTVTSDLSGYGNWVGQFGDQTKTGVYILKRKNQPLDASRDELLGRMIEFLSMSGEDRARLKKICIDFSGKARWSKFAEAYLKVHDQSAAKARQRMGSATYDRFRSFSAAQSAIHGDGGKISAHIRRFTVHNRLPSVMDRLRILIRENLWWCWNPEVGQLLEELDPELWITSGRNPLTFIDRIRPDRLEKVSKSKIYLERTEMILSRFAHYMSTKKETEVVYFCMEYGLSHVLKLYSGGLGILAGDHLKTASDMGIPLSAFGLAYRYGYFKQRITAEGAQEHVYEPNEFLSLTMTPVNDPGGKRIVFNIPSPQGSIWMQAWKVSVGRVDLYLLDTDISENSPHDRAITDRLYGGDTQHRLRQEYVLALGGYELIHRLGLKPRAYHMNEGHTAFLVLARMSKLMNDEKLKFEEALEYVRHSMGFTTHTPVAAGHDVFPEDMVAPYLQMFAEKLGENVPRLQELGASLERARGDRSFSMTLLAARGSSYINAVSRIHGKVSRRMFHTLVQKYDEHEVPVTHITNGVHAGTWLAPEFQNIFDEHLGEDWKEHLCDLKYWDKLRQIESGLIWNTHVEQKRKLVRWLKNHLRESWERRHEHPANLATALANLSEDTFIATFARRFAPYKRAHLLFRDPERLSKMLSGDTPIVFLFAGKAHPRDGLGQSLITKVIEQARKPEFFGKILFVENYEIDVAQLLVAGSDLWINTPTRPLEASGTSGMKAAMNGCLNLSVADGWWAEAYNGKNGWVVGDESLTQSPEFQDTFDSSHLYALLEREILPRYKARARGGVPEQWTSMMKECMASIIPTFNTERMLGEYQLGFYNCAVEQANAMREERFQEVRRLTASRKRVQENWNSIAFIDIDVKGLEQDQIFLTENLKLKVRLSHPNLRPQDIQVETILNNESHGGDPSRFQSHPMKCVADENEGRESVWDAMIQFNQTGPQSLGVRVTPRPCHPQHRVDFMLDLVKWL